MVDVTEGLALFGVWLGLPSLLLLIFMFSRLSQVKLFFLTKVRPMKNYGTVDIVAPGRVYTFVVPYVEASWDIYKGKYIRPVGEDEKHISIRWGVPYCQFHSGDGAHPLQVDTVSLTKSNNPQSIVNYLMGMKGLYESIADKDKKPDNKMALYLLGLTAVMTLAAAYFAWQNNNILHQILPTASDVLGNLAKGQIPKVA